MKVKIGDKIYDANEEPIMLVFEDNESLEKTVENMGQMVGNNSKKYCIFPEGMEVKKIKEFMKT